MAAEKTQTQQGDSSSSRLGASRPCKASGSGPISSDELLRSLGGVQNVVDCRCFRFGALWRSFDVFFPAAENARPREGSGQVVDFSADR